MDRTSTSPHSTGWLDDPRYGRTTTSVILLQLGQPDPALFQVPGDYKVIDQRQP